ncbi:Asp23/Gls24 family envelope stress response protein [Alkaliphilus sp. MSJ-5]|uniref:Asp23/Gls24 family envelope stress response protein n=1 Tax=Alkaliphilus flagellatus TaxID=2841507 RepID=A0ABS6G847_9FIRM|nr:MULTISPECIES: Asp23/Gls24 family envelope stress response protein [Alkaliphilus]MBU5677566.1 Asp23/Gls24 family envelope stress response protein [Alkaliphilus flagellatus]QUH20695.1 Asp23/Gls24 family envelope stress response protein [Alkaliphilus sp. B6464]
MDTIENLEYGEVKIVDDVVATIAGLAATEVKGVAGMSGGFVGDIAEILGKKSLSKGVKVEVKEKVANIDLYIIVEYGTKIPDVAWEIQENVKKTIETMTGIEVNEVNIHVQGVNFTNESVEQEGQLQQSK